MVGEVGVGGGGGGGGVGWGGSKYYGHYNINAGQNIIAIIK